MKQQQIAKTEGRVTGFAPQLVKDAKEGLDNAESKQKNPV